MKRMVQNVQYGHLKIVLPSGLIVEKIGAKPGPEATIVMHRWRALRRLVMAGDIGFAEGFLDADWTTPDLTSVIRFAAQNTQALSAVIDGHGLMRFGNRLRHRINANTKRGSRRNIEAHYDLGNDFYKH